MSAYLALMRRVLDRWEQAKKLPPCERCGDERRVGFEHICVAFIESERSLDDATVR